MGLVGGDGEPTGSVAADGRQVHAVEVGPQLGVDRVLRGLPRARHPQGGCPAGRGCAVGVVVVPLAAQRVGAVHQHVEATPLGAVELLHAEGGALARPVGELRAGQGERRRRQDLGDEPVLAETFDEVGGGVGDRLVDEHRPSDLLQRLAIGVGAEVTRAVTQLCGEVAHPERMRCSFWRWNGLRRRTRADSTSTTSRSGCPPWTELVREDPQRGVGHRVILRCVARPRTAA